MKYLLFGLLALSIGLPALRASAAEASYDEGIEYQRIDPAVPTNVPKGKVEVVEVFWYRCPHCFHFEPDLEKWLKHKPANVVFRRVPAQFGDVWRVHARVFYTEKILGVFDKMHEALFNAIHVQGRPLDTPEQLAKFFAEHGVNRDEFLKVYHSFAVRTKLAEADRLVRRYGVDSVPTIVVNGTYRTNASLAGGTYPKLLKVVDYLIAKETAAMKQSKAAAAGH